MDNASQFDDQTIETVQRNFYVDDRPGRRGILSIVSLVYDPLGFVAPCILSAKLILQDLCHQRLDWDDKIPDEYLKR